MREEMLITHCYAGFPSKDRRIPDMLEAPGWTPISFPVGCDNIDSNTRPRPNKLFEVNNNPRPNPAQTLEPPTQLPPTIQEPTEASNLNTMNSVLNTNQTPNTAIARDPPEATTVETPETAAANTLEVVVAEMVQT